LVELTIYIEIMYDSNILNFNQELLSDNKEKLYIQILKIMK